MKTTAQNLPHYVDLETAARLAHVSRRTVQNKLSSGLIPANAVKMAGKVKTVSAAALEKVFGKLQPPITASPLKDEKPGEVHGSFQEISKLEARLAAKNEIIASLQTTLDHERKDREHERENWRKALDQSQANLLAAQDTPTARALAGAPREATIEVAPVSIVREPKKPKQRREKKAASRWWRSILSN